MRCHGHRRTGKLIANAEAALREKDVELELVRRREEAQENDNCGVLDPA